MGYRKTTNDNIAMDSFLSKKTSPPGNSNANKPYSAHITGLANQETWEAERKGSDESNLPLRPIQAARPNETLMTRDISIA